MFHDRVVLKSKEADGYVIPLGPFNLVVAVTAVGFVGCGAFDVAALDKFSYPAARAKSFVKIHSINELDAVIADAKGKKVLLDFYADWCTSCKELEYVTFADPAVKARMAEFVLVQADVTANTDEEKALTKKFGLFGPPGIIFFDENGAQMKGREIIGYKSPEEFLAHLERIK